MVILGKFQNLNFTKFCLTKSWAPSFYLGHIYSCLNFEKLCGGQKNTWFYLCFIVEKLVHLSKWLFIGQNLRTWEVGNKLSWNYNNKSREISDLKRKINRCSFSVDHISILRVINEVFHIFYSCDVTCKIFYDYLCRAYKDLQCISDTFSTYKNRNSGKNFTGIAPRGDVIWYLFQNYLGYKEAFRNHPVVKISIPDHLANSTVTLFLLFWF